MKEFEKWAVTEEGSEFRDSEYEEQEVAWRAALKRVQKAIIKEENGPSNPQDLMDWLHEELGE